MKKLLILFISVLSMSTLNAQDISDALRYSNGDLQGTARFRAMSGAFGALGGDLSALSINPAGSAIFNRSYASLSISNLKNNTKTNYFGGLNSNSNSSFDFNQVGAVFVFNNMDDKSPWGKFTLGLSYEQLQNYDDNFFASGTNTRSIDSYFLGYAQGLRLDEISAFDDESITEAYGDIGAVFGFANQQGFLGYESYILEPETDEDTNTVYTSNIAPGSFYQEYSYAATGYNGKFGVNGAIQYDENIYLGLNLNSHFINYERSTFLYETNSNVGSLVNEVGFENNLSTVGSGFSFQLGTIAKVNESLRIGFAYDSPIWYTLSEETTQYLSTVRNDAGTNVTTTLNPQIVNIFPDYKLQTPSKITGSAALVLGKQGLISFDYSRKDYSKTKFKPETDSHFNIQNMIISNTLKAANSYKIGGELRFDQLSLRGGYRFEESPYQDTTFYGDLTGYSLGLGYNFGGTTIDLAYQNSERKLNYQLYNIGLTDSAKLNTDNSLVTLTLNLRL
jgi:hypothetical protein